MFKVKVTENLFNVDIRANFNFFCALPSVDENEGTEADGKIVLRWTVMDRNTI